MFQLSGFYCKHKDPTLGCKFQDGGIERSWFEIRMLQEVFCANRGERRTYMDMYVSGCSTWWSRVRITGLELCL